MNCVLYCGRIIRPGVIWENWRPRLETVIWHMNQMTLAGRTSAENTSDHPKTGCHLRGPGAANWWGCSPDSARECVAGRRWHNWAETVSMPVMRSSILALWSELYNTVWQVDLCFHKLCAVSGIVNTNIAFCSLCFHKLCAVCGIMNN